jgi:hypothetical protein
MVYFSDQKLQFGKILEGLAREDVGIFMAILSILQPTGIFYGHLVHFVVIWYIFCPFWYVAARKIWQPWLGSFCARARVLFQKIFSPASETVRN